MSYLHFYLVPVTLATLGQLEIDVCCLKYVYLLGLVELTVRSKRWVVAITVKVKTGKSKVRSKVFPPNRITFPLLMLRIIVETQEFLKLEHEL